MAEWHTSESTLRDSPDAPLAQGKWITFELEHQDPKRKTQSWAVVAKDGDAILGFVHWHGPWRQYSFFPNNYTLYEKQCLIDIAQFIEQRTREHRMHLKVRRTDENTSN